jgi:hypothetical protein
MQIITKRITYTSHNKKKHHYLRFIFFLASISAALRVVDLGTLRSLLRFLTFYEVRHDSLLADSTGTYRMSIEVLCFLLICCETFVLLGARG